MQKSGETPTDGRFSFNKPTALAPGAKLWIDSQRKHVCAKAGRPDPAIVGEGEVGRGVVPQALDPRRAGGNCGAQPGTFDSCTVHEAKWIN